MQPIALLMLAALLDYLIGDPWGWPHPVRLMGWLIERYSKLVFGLTQPNQPFQQEIYQRVAGIGLALGLIGGSGLIGWALVWIATQFHPLLGLAIATVLLASCFAGRSLRAAAIDVLVPLEAGNLEAARSRLSFYVGRDTADLSKPDILRAVLETVSENAVDGVMAPLFYGLLGLCFPLIGSVPFALAYKAASTLDSTVGYKEAPYTYLGWFPARLEDVLTWLPCRLTVLTLALLSGRPLQVWRICQRDGPQDPSPNAGWSEAAYAAVLKVQMGGLNTYRGVAKVKPLLGDPLEDITPAKIEQALQLNSTIFLLWLLMAFLLWFICSSVQLFG